MAIVGMPLNVFCAPRSFEIDSEVFKIDFTATPPSRRSTFGFANIICCSTYGRQNAISSEDGVLFPGGRQNKMFVM